MNASTINTSRTLEPALPVPGRAGGEYGNPRRLLDRTRYLRPRPSPHALEIRTRRLFWTHTALSGLACLMFFGGICFLLWGL